MTINWLGMSCFKIQTKEATLIIDPFDDKCGLKMPKAKVEIVLSSDPNNYTSNNIGRLMGEPLVINHPGEYEKSEIFVSAMTAGDEDQTDKSIFFLEIEGVTLSHLGSINHSLSTKQLEIMEGVDILMLPVSSLSSDKIAKIISQIEPRIILPMNYKISGVKEKLETLDKFIKEIGAKPEAAEEKLKITKKDLPEEETKIIILNPSK